MSSAVSHCGVFARERLDQMLVQWQLASDCDHTATAFPLASSATWGAEAFPALDSSCFGSVHTVLPAAFRLDHTWLNPSASFSCQIARALPFASSATCG